MAQKKGAGGKNQEYNVDNGRYSNDTDYFTGEERQEEKANFFNDPKAGITFRKEIDEKIKNVAPLSDEEIEEVFEKMFETYEKPERGKGDKNLKKILDLNGFSKTPRKVGKKKLADELQNGEILFRGLNGEGSKQYANQFYNGEMYVGIGFGGNGVYMSREINEADNYTKGSNTVVVAVIPKNMKIAGKDVRKEYNEFYERQKAKAENTKQEKERSYKIQRTMSFGSYCALKGYDAYLPTISPEKNMVVLNRGKLFVGENNEQERILESYRTAF